MLILLKLISNISLDYKVNDIKDKAYDAAVSKSDLQSYKNYIVNFPKWRNDEIVDNAYNLVKSLNSIDKYNEFIKVFPDANYKDSVIYIRDYLIVDNFYKNIKTDSLMFKMILLDDFCVENPNNVSIKDFLIQTIVFNKEMINADVDVFYNSYYPMKFKSENVKSNFEYLLLNKVYNSRIKSNKLLYEHFKHPDNIEDVNPEWIKENIIPDIEKRSVIIDSIADKYKDSKYVENALNQVKKYYSLEETFYKCLDITMNMDKYDDNAHYNNVKDMEEIISCKIKKDYPFQLSKAKIIVINKLKNKVIEKNCLECEGWGKITNCKVCNGKGKIEVNYFDYYNK